MSKYKVKKSLSIGKIIALAGFASAIVGIAYFTFAKSSDKARVDRSTDPATNCRQNTEIPALRAVVLDRTDPWSEQQKIALKNVVAQITKELTEGQKLLLLPLDGIEAATINPQFEKCAPKNPGDASALTENAKIVQQKFKQIFGDPLLEALNKFAVEKTQKESPILEALQTIGKDHLSPKITKDRTIYLFSDMMQNSSKYTFFNVANLRTEKASQIAETDVLKGISVKIYQLPRCDVAKLQVQARHFWEAWFAARGAKAEYVTLPGSNESCQNIGAEKKSVLPPEPAQVRATPPTAKATPIVSKPAIAPPRAVSATTPSVIPPAPQATQSAPSAKAAEPVSPSGICSTSANYFMRNDCMWRRCTREFVGHPDCAKYIRETNTGG